MGRKRILIDMKAVEEAAADGLTYEEVAARLGISQDTLYERKRELSEFSDAIKRGRDRAHAEVSSQLFKKIKKGDLGAIVWWEKTRKHYSDRTQTEITGAGGGALNVKTYNYATAIAAIAPGPVDDSESSGENQNSGDGQAVGEVADGS